MFAVNVTPCDNSPLIVRVPVGRSFTFKIGPTKPLEISSVVPQSSVYETSTDIKLPTSVCVKVYEIYVAPEIS